jgi:hypothetical protein
MANNNNNLRMKNSIAPLLFVLLLLLAIAQPACKNDGNGQYGVMPTFNVPVVKPEQIMYEVTSPIVGSRTSRFGDAPLRKSVVTIPDTGTYRLTLDLNIIAYANNYGCGQGLCEVVPQLRVYDSISRTIATLHVGGRVNASCSSVLEDAHYEKADTQRLVVDDTLHVGQRKMSIAIFINDNLMLATGAGGECGFGGGYAMLYVEENREVGVVKIE